jgi:dipeptidyl aminopeptidase/acylaminoacyl peptidase
MNLKRSASLALFVAACGGGHKPAVVPVDKLPGDDGTGTASGDGSGSDTTEPAVAKGHPKDDLIPREVLYGNPVRGGAQISPDGKYISWTAPSDGVMNLWVAPVADLTKGAPVTTEKERPIRGGGWSADSNFLLYQQDKKGDENFHTFSVDIAHDNKITDLYPVDGARVEIMGASLKHKTTLVIGANDRNPQFFDLYTYDLATNKKTLLYQNDAYASVMVDDDFKLRFADKSMPDGSTEMDQYDAKKKAWTKYDTIGIEDGLSTGFAGFDKKGTGFYLIDSRDRDTGAIFHVDIKTKKKKLIAADDKVDIGQTFSHPTDKTIRAVMLDYDKPRWKVLDKKIQKDFDALGKVEDGSFGVISGTTDDKTWLVAYESDHQAPHLYKWDRKTQKAELLWSIQPALDEAPLARMYPEVIKSRDGLDLVSYLTLPNDADADHDGKPDKAVPMVLFVHGGPWARDEWGFNVVHQQLANRGYAVLSVNYRGSTGFGKKFLNAGDLQWGKKMHDDLIDAVQWAIDQGVAPKDQICIMGGSYGGYATLVGVSMTPDVFACGVDLVGPSDLVTFQETIPAYWGPFIPVLHARVGDPTTDEGKKALEEVSPLTHAGDIKVPLMIGQGQNDPRVNERESRQIVAAMKKKNIPVSYLLFPDEGHGFARPENNIAFFALAEAFLSVHLGGYYQPITQDELAASSMQVVEGKEWLPGLPQASGNGKEVSAE